MKIFITGGAGYVGAMLVPELLRQGHEVVVLDLMMYGENVFGEFQNHVKLQLIKGDIRDQALLKKNLQGVDTVIHLACISNDPSFELNPNLGKSINLDAFEPLVLLSKQSGVKRFIYASSSSVYGIKAEQDVTEELSLEPLTDYSKFKADCEKILFKHQADNFTCVVIRPATVCGYSPRQRLDVVVNILTNLAYNTGKIKVLGGAQMRPNIHIKDMVQAYVALLNAPAEKIQGKIYNAGYLNHTVDELGSIVEKVVGKERTVQVERVPTNDNRSYHVSSKKIKEELGFVAMHTVEEAVADLVQAFKDGKLPNSLEDQKYYNIKVMQAIGLK